ncbi:MAG: class I SAM-dependent methyltransferase [Dehalogenimonas sp.]|uniref:Class I SAM-dependent methyltransferase n=1 Tax=Candidatus Dehalogenimonas loeffleri TaxID=3127115 RepID=A0ABZ2J1U2_9CHLR|nr:class I SAM-dependent methyltransferase [Dehalogenimonas sp.]
MNQDNHFSVKMSGRLDNPDRIAELRIPELLAEVGCVEAGMVCVDLGAGTGTFTLPLAELAGPTGQVYAVDDSGELLDVIKGKHPPPNVTLIQADFTASGLASGMADFCLAAFVLHETKSPDKLLTEAYRLLKSGGRLLVMEWRAEFDSPGPPQHIRVSACRSARLFREAGFTEFNFLNWTSKHYYSTAEKP